MPVLHFPALRMYGLHQWSLKPMRTKTLYGVDAAFEGNELTPGDIHKPQNCVFIDSRNELALYRQQSTPWINDPRSRLLPTWLTTKGSNFNQCCVNWHILIEENWFRINITMVVLGILEKDLPCKHSRTRPVLGRCCQHRPRTGPFLAHNGIFTGWIVKYKQLWLTDTRDVGHHKKQTHSQNSNNTGTLLISPRTIRFPSAPVPLLLVWSHFWYWMSFWFLLASFLWSY